jgi:hypothetical protein
VKLARAGDVGEALVWMRQDPAVIGSMAGERDERALEELRRDQRVPVMFTGTGWVSLDSGGGTSGCSVRIAPPFFEEHQMPVFESCKRPRALVLGFSSKVEKAEMMRILPPRCPTPRQATFRDVAP